eukprot:PhM_4_TR1279/c1_g1_i8/m.84639
MNTLKTSGNDYEYQRLTLFFVDAELERRYCEYVYRHSGFIGGKVILFYFVVIIGLFFIGHTISHLDVLILRIVGGAVFVFWLLAAPLWMRIAKEHFWRHIEKTVILSLFLLAMSTFTSAHERNEAQANYVTSVLALMHCFLIICVLPARFAPASTVLSIAALITSIIHYMRYESGHPLHCLWYFLYLLTIPVHYQRELQNRRFFEDIDRCERELDAVDVKLEALNDIVVNYLPPTAAQGLLSMSADISEDDSIKYHHTPYPNTVLVVTDLVGFTAWSSRTPTSVVVDVLARCFVELDETATSYGVEKITTVGDSYVGAVFPTTTTDNGNDDCALRCVRGIRFGLVAAELPSHVLPHLRNRVGVHVGNVVGGFVGTSPPRFDLFGFATDLAKHMESTCEPGYVHVSLDAYDRARRVGRGVDVLETEEDGVLLSGWVMNGDMKNDAVPSLHFTDAERREVCSMFISSFAEKGDENRNGNGNSADLVAVARGTWSRINADERAVYATYMTQKSNFLAREALAVVFLALIYIVVCYSTVACLEESFTRTCLALNMAALMIGFIFVPNATGITRFVSCVVCLSVASVSFSVTSIKCLSDRRSAVVLFNAGMALMSVLSYLPLFCLDVRMGTRLIGCAIALLCFPLQWLLRESLRGDEDNVLGFENPYRPTTYWIATVFGVVACTMNFELTARAGFKATRKIEAALHSHGTFARASERVLAMLSMPSTLEWASARRTTTTMGRA